MLVEVAKDAVKMGNWRLSEVPDWVSLIDCCNPMSKDSAYAISGVITHTERG